MFFPTSRLYLNSQVTSVSKHSDSNGTRLMAILICAGACCVFIPICGLWLGPLMYYLQMIQNIDNPTPGPTQPPTSHPTSQPSLEILEILNESLYNITNITNITI